MTVRDQAIAAGKAAQQAEAVKPTKPPCNEHKWVRIDRWTRQCDNCRVVQARPQGGPVTWLFTESATTIIPEKPHATGDR